MNESLKEATVIYAEADYVICPHCDERVDGWYGNPRGEETTYDACGEPFKVSAHADVELT